MIILFVFIAADQIYDIIQLIESCDCDIAMDLSSKPVQVSEISRYHIAGSSEATSAHKMLIRVVKYKLEL